MSHAAAYLYILILPTENMHASNFPHGFEIYMIYTDQRCSNTDFQASSESRELIIWEMNNFTIWNLIQ